MKHVVVATHGYCFDGLASAVVFTRLVRALSPGATFTYRACGYGPGQLIPTEAVLTGDENAILDYRFTRSERLTWYFDHHRTAFASREDRAFFDARVTSQRYFYDEACSSCTKLIAAMAKEKFGVTIDDLSELVANADKIDSAAFATPEEALDRSNPVMRLAAVIERHGDDELLRTLVPLLLERPLGEIARSPDIEQRYRAIAAQHDRFVGRLQERAERRGRVVLVDLTDEPLETIGKFVTYALYPDAVYSVIIGLLESGVKLSVGYNPWSGKPCDVDISAICARYGGGGHPFVGAVQFGIGEFSRAREVAEEITRELSP